jgi:hypothetical protein
VSQADPKSDVLVLQLSRHHSVDLVRLPQSRKYRIVFAERWGVQRRAFVEISFEEALTVAKFLANIDDGMRATDPDDPPTDPGRPMTVPPMAIQEVFENGEVRDAIQPSALDPATIDRTKPK